MSLLSYIDELKERFKGDRAKVVGELVKEAKKDEELLTEIVERCVPVWAASRAALSDTLARRRAFKEMETPTTVRPRFGDSAKVLRERTAAADRRSFEFILNYPLWGGTYVRKSTASHVRESIRSRNKRVSAENRAIAFEKEILACFPRGSNKTFEEVVTDRQLKALAGKFKAALEEAA